MKTSWVPHSSSLFLLIFISPLFSSHASGVRAVTFHILNKCPFSVWPAIAPNTGEELIADGGFFLPAGMSKWVDAPPSWNGRVWARTGCEFGSGGGCLTGDCQGLMACNGTVGTPPATILEVSLQAGDGEPSFFDVSLLDGYNLPISMTARPAEEGCFIGGCRRSPNSDCPVDLRVVDGGSGQVVACKSACLAYGLDEFCCRNDYGTAETCSPSAFAGAFKEACPSYIAFAFEAPAPIVACAAAEYAVTFCPSQWSST